MNYLSIYDSFPCQTKGLFIKFLSPTFPRYPHVRLKTAIKAAKDTSEENQISVSLLRGAMLHRISKGINAIRATTANPTPTSVQGPGCGHWVRVAMERPVQSLTDWTRKQLQEKIMRKRKSNYYKVTPYWDKILFIPWRRIC